MKYLKWILLSLIILIPCTVMILIYNGKIIQEAPVYYKKGVQQYNEGKYSEAYYTFGRIKRFSPLYPAAVLKQAKSARRIGDYKTAAYKYDLFLKKMPNSIFSRNARLNLAKSYYYLKQYDKAEAEFKKLAEKSGSAGSEEIFFLGLTVKNYDRNKAADYYRQYIKSVLDGSADESAYIISAVKELHNSGIELSDEDIKLIGRAYFKERRYQDSLKYFSKLPSDTAGGYYALANHYAGNKEAAKKLIETNFASYAKNAEGDDLYELYNIYASYRNGSRKNVLLHLKKEAGAYNLPGADYLLFKLAENASSAKAEEYYREIYEKYPEGRFAADALQHIIFNEYARGEYKTAERLAVHHLKTYKKVLSTPKTAFWLGKTYLKQNRMQEARSIFTRLASKYPDSYYGLRAAHILESNTDFWQISFQNPIPEKNTEADFPVFVSNTSLKDLKIINEIFTPDDYEIWLDAGYSNPIAESWFEYKKGSRQRSMVLARDEIFKMNIKPHIMSSAYKLAYPVYSASEINTAGRKLGIDPFLITAVIREESYFNEHAKSRTGASGLMQLMPKTADYMIKRLNMQGRADLEDAKTNIYLGCNYLKYLMERFDSGLMVIAAYNGGEGSVRRWMKNSETLDFDEFIENIPYEETRHYVKKVFRTYHMYKKIYKR